MLRKAAISVKEYNDDSLHFEFAHGKAHTSFINQVLKNYRIYRRGTGIYFHNLNDGSLSCYFNSFDNTMLICDPSGYALAELIGTKRFPVGNARVSLEEKQIESVKAQKFSRDLSFPLEVKEEPQGDFTVQDLEEYQYFKNFDIHDELAQFFNKCADFTPGKQQEYLSGGKLADKYCRFNITMASEHSGIRTLNFFLLNEAKELVGTISALVHKTKQGIIDIYLYDEIVNPYLKMSEAELKELNRLTTQLHKTPEAEQAPIKEKISAIVEPHRKKLLKHLFSAARIGLKQKMSCSGAHAFIRAAAGRVQHYQELGCGTENKDNYVIHGPQSDYAKVLDEHIKEYATQRLQNYSSYQTTQIKSAASRDSVHHSWMIKAGISALIGAVGFFAYKALNNEVPNLDLSSFTPKGP